MCMKRRSRADAWAFAWTCRRRALRRAYTHKSCRCMGLLHKHVVDEPCARHRQDIVEHKSRLEAPASPRLSPSGRGAGHPRQNTNSSCEKSWHAQNLDSCQPHHRSEPLARHSASSTTTPPSSGTPLRPAALECRSLSGPPRLQPALPNDADVKPPSTRLALSPIHAPPSLLIMADAIQERLKKLGQGARIGESATAGF